MAKIKELTRSDRPIMQMSFKSLRRSMVRNMEETFLPKPGMQKKQVLQDSGYVGGDKGPAACCMVFCKVV